MKKALEKRLNKPLKKLIAFVFWMGIWYLLSLLADVPLLFPNPGRVFLRLIELAKTGDFYFTILKSFGNVVSGIVTGLFLSFLFSVLIVKSKTAEILLPPLLSTVQSTPIASFIILVFLFLGSDTVPFLITLLVTVPTMVFALTEGHRNLDKKLGEVATVYRFDSKKRFKAWILPGIFPYFLSALRSCIGMAWKAGIAAEIMVRSLGTIGYAISEGKQYLNAEDVFAWTAVTVLLSILIEKATFALLKRRKSA